MEKDFTWTSNWLKTESKGQELKGVGIHNSGSMDLWVCSLLK